MADPAIGVGVVADPTPPYQKFGAPLDGNLNYTWITAIAIL